MSSGTFVLRAIEERTTFPCTAECSASHPTFKGCVVLTRSKHRLSNREPSDTVSDTRGNSIKSCKRPLAGIRIVDFGQVILLPFVTRWLAWLGAGAILIESADGPFSGDSTVCK